MINILCVAACSLPWEVGNYTVCDNVDLKMVLTEFESYHQVNHTPQIYQIRILSITFYHHSFFPGCVTLSISFTYPPLKSSFFLAECLS
jgi:hypothetical protein